ncbi:hypothetical protein CI109_105821 [Kwoniella shandongensis]|uniref:Uncharacterized protein n=1 Tax=Kwoniella shandongensis TaxID=1734106 RepID=A0A5M6C0E5_9TREE|nr:uncharacterized protein CI109_003160 [Kwoniella shandongensis]KAA5528628.1 hypothetical protein CI109_003160 [Kwoniella shandongensis]
MIAPKDEIDDVSSPASKSFAAKLAKYAYGATTSTVGAQKGESSKVGSSSPLKFQPRSRVIRTERNDNNDTKSIVQSTSSSSSGILSNTQVLPKNRIDDSSSRSLRNRGTKRPYREVSDSASENELSGSGSEGIIGSDKPFQPSNEEEVVRTPSKKKQKQKTEEGGVVVKKERAKTTPKKPRGYAAPEVYEHLKPVNDILREGLDVVFCGIKYVDYTHPSHNHIPGETRKTADTLSSWPLLLPIGKRSSTLGHHFSHPTNKFWRSLHQSGLTARLLSPLEDELMMTEYNSGLTNLVDRPTSEQSELSTLEMRLNVHNLTLKFVRYRPMVVCFVGKKIWDVYESVAGKTAKLAAAAAGAEEEAAMEQKSLADEVKRELKEEEEEDDVKPDLNEMSYDGVKLENEVEHDLKSINDIKPPIPSLKPTEVRTPTKSPKAKTKTKAKTKIKPPPFDPTQPRLYRLPHFSLEQRYLISYTYFWVVPNTSGLERTPLSDQIINFTALKVFVDKLKSGWQPSLEDGYSFKDIDVDGVKRTVEEMQRVALSKGV